MDDSAQFYAQVADVQQQRDANRPPLGALAVDVNAGDREIGARWVRRSAEIASSNHASTAHEENLSEQRSWIGVHVTSRAKVSPNGAG